MRRAAALVLIASCGGAAASDSPDASDRPDAAVDASVDAPRPAPGAARGSFELTYYWVTAEADFPGTASVDLFEPDCTVLETVTPGFADSLDTEGTGRLVDGRLVNVTGSCGCAHSPCYAETDAEHPWGVGVQDRPLVPYRSLAVDRRVIAYGTKLWIAELDGVAMPGDPPWGGFIHDGCMTAVDTGGAIVGTHLDWFVGLRASYRTLDDGLGLGDVTAYDGGERCP